MPREEVTTRIVRAGRPFHRRAPITAVLLFAASLPTTIAGAASPDTPAAKRFVSLLVGQQIVLACGGKPSPASTARLAAELATRRRRQHEISDREIAVMTRRLHDNLSASANRDVCRQLDEIGADAYVDLVVTQ